MNDIKFQFSTLTPEKGMVFVKNPQLVVYENCDRNVEVCIYFMANNGLEISEGIVRSAMGKIRLWCCGRSPCGAWTASQRLIKVKFIFPEPQGLARNFEFVGIKVEKIE